MSFLRNLPFIGPSQTRYATLYDDDDEVPVAAQESRAASLFNKINPFRSNPVQLPIDQEAQQPAVQEPLPTQGLFEFSRWDRLIIFAVAMAGALSCWIVCFLLFPVLSLKPRKFAILWSLGSILFLFSFGALHGAKLYLIHLFSIDRLWFTISFTASIVVTLVSSLVLHSTILAIIACIVQLICSVAYTISYFPFGKNGLRLASNVAIVQVDSWINS